MATVTTGYTFVNNETVTPAKLNSLAGGASVSAIVNADIDASAAIVDTKLATIATAGKVANSATTATTASTASTIVLRDGSGNFTASTVIDGAVTPAKLSTGGPNWDTIGNLTALRIIAYGAGGVISNLALGNNSLVTNTTGSNNTAVGVNALGYTTTGNYNTAVGANCLNRNTTGDSNTAIGVSALNNNATANNNLAIGVNTLLNSNGDSNVGIGSSALINNTNGASNIGIGVNVLHDNSSGNQNSAVGQEAMYKNTTGYSNTAVGHQALYNNTTGAANIAVGKGALSSNTGNGNIGIGVNAGNALTTGNNNTIIGTYLTATAGLSNTLILGAGAVERIRVNDVGNMGIGVSSPTQKLDVAGWVNTDANSGVLFGFSGCLIQRSAGDGSLLLQTNQANLNLATNSSTRLAISQDGQINAQGNPISNCQTTAKAWVAFAPNGTITRAYNVSSVSRTATGQYTVYFNSTLSDYPACVASCESMDGSASVTNNSQTSVQIFNKGYGNSGADKYTNVIAFSK
jgi:hypothetical protein